MSELLPHDVDGDQDGPRVLLLHTGATHRAMWDPQWPTLLAQGFRVVRCDLRGYAGEVPTGRVDHLADLEALLAHLDWRDVTVVGPSYGGYVALSLAATSDRVARLVLVDALTPTLQPCARMRALFDGERAALAAGDLDAAVQVNVDTWVGPRATAGREAFARMQREVFDVQLATPDDADDEIAPEPDVATIGVPTTVVVGLLDLPSFVDAARELAATMPDATLVELDWAGHVPSLEDPEAFEPVLLDALRHNGSGG